MIRRRFLKLIASAAIGICTGIHRLVPDIAPEYEFTREEFEVIIRTMSNRMMRDIDAHLLASTYRSAGYSFDDAVRVTLIDIDKMWPEFADEPLDLKPEDLTLFLPASDHPTDPA